MILVCPSCDTRYFAEPASIGKEGRRVRCATCGHAWHAVPPDEEGAAPPPAEDIGLTREQVERLRQTAQANSKASSGPHAEYRAREHARRRRDHGRAVGVAWAIGAGIFFLAAAGAVLFRNEVAEAFPKVASIYRLIGLEANRFGLALENVNAKRSFDGTTPVLTVTGAVVNTTKERVPTPQLRVTLKDEAGKEVQTWTDKFRVPSLGPGEKSEFVSRFEAPPVETYRLTVSLARPGADAPAAGSGPAKAAPVSPAAAGGKLPAVPAGSGTGPAITPPGASALSPPSPAIPGATPQEAGNH